MQTIRLLTESNLKDKVVLVRVDHNVVKKGKIIDPYRIDATIGTICHILLKGGKPILMTHVGRPKDKKTGAINISSNDSVEPIVEYLKKKLAINFVIPTLQAQGEDGYTSIEAVKPLVADLRAGKIDGIYLPNTRWFRGEEDKAEKGVEFAKQLASLADIYVNDAFGSWQAHASTAKVADNLPAYCGLLMQKEIEHLSQIFQPNRPLLAVVAGSKFDTKIEPLNALIKQADHLLLGGVLYNAYLCAKYNCKINGIADEDIALAKQFIETANQYPGKLVELPYIVESDLPDAKVEGKYRTHHIKDIAGKTLNYVFDAGAASFDDPAVKDVFMQAQTIFINAVMGFTPNFTEGTIAMYSLIDTNKTARKLYGGGDTLQEFKTLLPGTYLSAIDNPTYYLFTGGGAVLNAIEAGTATGMEPVKKLLK